MLDMMEKLKQKKAELEKVKPKSNSKKDAFKKIEELEGRTIYHTKFFSDINIFGTTTKDPDKFFLVFRDIFDLTKISSFNLFKTKEDDKFIGIKYGYLKLEKPFIIKNFEKKESYTLRKIHYIEFKFKKGSVFCYISSLYSLIKKTRIENKYHNAVLFLMNKLEREVYEFYGKKLPEGGIIRKWIEKNQK